MSGRRGPMTRIGDLLPDAARGLGLEDELRLSRTMATFDQLVAERVPTVAGACHVERIDGDTIVVEAMARGVADINRQVRELAPALNSPDVAGGASVASSKEGVQVDFVVTPTRVIRCPRGRRPRGVIQEHLDAEKIASIPALRGR